MRYVFLHGLCKHGVCGGVGGGVGGAYSFKATGGGVAGGVSGAIDVADGEVAGAIEADFGLFAWWSAMCLCSFVLLGNFAGQRLHANASASALASACKRPSSASWR